MGLSASSELLVLLYVTTDQLCVHRSATDVCVQHTSLLRSETAGSCRSETQTCLSHCWYDMSEICFFSVHEHYYYYYLQFCLTGIFSRDRVPPGHGKSWNLGRPFSRPGKSWKIAKVMESHGKVMENDDNVMVFLLLH